MSNEFEQEQVFSPEDFRTEDFPKVKPVTQDDINRAATLALLEADPVSSFVGMTEERAAGEDSVTRTDLVTKLQEDTEEEIQQEIYQILGDPSLTVEQRREKASAVQDKSNEVFEPRNIVATELAATPSFGEQVDKEEQTIDWAKNITEWNRYIAYKQRALASFTARQGGGQDTLKDFFEIAELFLTPFVEASLVQDLAKNAAEDGLISEDKISVWGSPSTNLEAIKGTLKSGTIEQRKEAIGKLLEFIDQGGKGFNLYNTDFAKVDLARKVLEDDYFGEIDGTLADAGLVAELAATAYPAISAGKSLKFLTNVSEGGRTLKDKILSDVRNSYTKGGADPSSPAELSRNTNIDQAKKLHEALQEGGDDFANAAYGTDKGSAVVDDVMPDPIDADGVIKNKVENVESFVDEVYKILDESGRIQITEAERIEARQRAIKKIEEGGTDDISYRKSSSQFGELDERGAFKFRAVYGATDQAGFTNPETAIEQALFANRDRGAVREDLTLLKRDSTTGDYKPTTLDDVEGNDFLVQLDMNYEIGAKDLKFMSAEDAKLVDPTLVDRFVPSLQGKASSYLKVMESTFNANVITRPVLAEAERATLVSDTLKTRIDSFVEQFKGLTIGQQNRVDEYLREANLQGIPFSPKDLRAKGWSTKEIETVSTFRQYYDDIWTLENRAEIKELSSDGFGLIKSGDGSEFISKPVTAEEAGVVGNFYNSRTGEVRPLTELGALGDEADRFQLYKLPAEADTKDFSFAYVLSDPKDWRALREFDTVKAYRAGYYTVDYTDPLFVVKSTTRADGTVRRNAVATAGDVQSAKREASRLQANNTETGVTYDYRSDIRDVKAAKRQVNAEHGRYNMKFRGERLLSSSGVSDEGLRAPIKDPLSSMIASADKISKRVTMSETWETITGRFMSAYKDVLTEGQYPMDVAEIAARAPKDARKAAEARVLYNWIESQKRIENIADQGVQEALTSLAETLGEKGFAKSEKFIRNVGPMEPVAGTKKAVYTIFVSMNPARQLTLGAVDSLKALAIAPGYVASGKIFRDSTAMVMRELGVSSKTAAKQSGRRAQEVEQLASEFKRSGLSAGINKQAQVQAGVTTAAEEVPLAKAVKGESVLSKTIGLADRAGFQTAERMQNMASWLAFRANKAKQTGRFNLTKAELDEVTADARHFAYSQTKEASPAYNTSVLATAMQFAGVLHKGISLTLPELLGGSKVLSAAQKTKLWGFFIAMYGVSFTESIDKEVIKIEDKETRETLRSGLLWLTLYKTTGADLSTKSLNPADYAGFADKIKQVVNGEWAKASPALGLANKVKYNAQVAAGLWGDVGSDILEMDTAEKVKTQAQALLTFFPSASNFMKAKIAEKMNRSVSQYNFTRDAEITTSESVFKMLGFQTKEETDRFLIRNIRKAKKEERETDVKALFDNIKAVAAIKGLSNEEIAQRLAVSSVFWQAYDKDPIAVDMVDKQLKFLLTEDDSVYQMMTRMLGMLEAEELQGVNNIAPMTEEQREQVSDMIKTIESFKEVE